MAYMHSFALLGRNIDNFLLDVVGMRDPRNNGPLCMDIYIDGIPC